MQGFDDHLDNYGDPVPLAIPTQSDYSYDVIDLNGDILESHDSWWIACAKARENGFSVRDNETGEITFLGEDNDEEMNRDLEEYERNEFGSVDF